MKVHEEKKFKKDLAKVLKQEKDFSKLYDVIEMLLSMKKLEKKYIDHTLKGNFKGYRECHIEPDWLLIYKVDNDILYLARTGSHSDLF